MPDAPSLNELSNDQLVDRFIEVQRLSETALVRVSGRKRAVQRESEAIQHEVGLRSKNAGRRATAELMSMITTGSVADQDTLYGPALKEVLDRKPGAAFVAVASSLPSGYRGTETDVNVSLLVGLGPLTAALPLGDQRVLAAKCVAAARKMPVRDRNQPSIPNFYRSQALEAASLLGATNLRPLLAEDFAVLGAQAPTADLFLASLSKVEKEGAVRVLNELLVAYSATDHLYSVLREFHLAELEREAPVAALADQPESGLGLQRYFNDPRSLQHYLSEPNSRQRFFATTLEKLMTEEYWHLLQAVTDNRPLTPIHVQQLRQLTEMPGSGFKGEPVINIDSSGYLGEVFAYAAAGEPRIVGAVAIRMGLPDMDITSLLRGLDQMGTPSAIRALERFTNGVDVGDAKEFAHELLEQRAPEPVQTRWLG